MTVEGLVVGAVTLHLVFEFRVLTEDHRFEENRVTTVKAVIDAEEYRGDDVPTEVGASNHSSVIVALYPFAPLIHRGGYRFVVFIKYVKVHGSDFLG